MKILTIYGASDDLIETEGIEGCDEFDNYSDGRYKGYLHVHSTDGSINIHVIYDGCWSFAVSPWPNEEKLPWEVRRTWGNKQPYSETLEIDVPDDAKLRYENAR